MDGQVRLTYSGKVTSTANAGGDLRTTMIGWGRTDSNNVDDVYVCDRLGSEFNDYLGEVQVEGLFPNGNGTYSQFVGSDGNSVDNYLLVDEAPAVETDLVSSDVVGAKDTYQFANLLVAAGQILAVSPTAAISKTNAGESKMKIVERLANGTERKSVSFVATNLTQFNEIPKTRDPEGAVWTVASVNAAEFGVEVV